MHARKERSFDEHYDNLSRSQILTIYTHQRFGYILWFVRTLKSGKKMAVLKQGENLVSVNHEGKAKKEFNFTLRKMDSVNPNA